MRESTISTVLVNAACMSLRTQGELQASIVLKYIPDHPEKAKAFQEDYQTSLSPKS